MWWCLCGCGVGIMISQDLVKVTPFLRYGRHVRWLANVRLERGGTDENRIETEEMLSLAWGNVNKNKWHGKEGK